ncbi:MAG: aa3-type cytochrome c oxidase subunit IV [Pseudomonadota bacterium]|nr:aa3-type cytochrome c oxidase subunit IV [Pseudomonadota bacterium]
MANAEKNEQAPAMDYAEHERTYEGFLKLTKWSIIHIVNVMIALTAGTVGGMGVVGFVLVLIVLTIAAYFLF